MHFHLVLTDLGAIVAAFAHDIGALETLLHIAELEQHVAFDIARLARMPWFVLSQGPCLVSKSTASEGVNAGIDKSDLANHGAQRARFPWPR